jgi:hypothetical protein
MGQARLTRIDAVEEMSAAVDAFRNEATAALEMLDMEIRRALEWIHHDRHEYWNHQVRRGWERITEARVQLQQAMTARRIGEHDPACIDEKKALARAKQRLEVAQEKVEAVRHFARAIDRAVDEYRGARTPLSSWLESEAPKALATLRRMMDHLEGYLAVHASGGEAAGVMGSGDKGEDRGERGEGSGEKGDGSASLPLASDSANDIDQTPTLSPLPSPLPPLSSPLPAPDGATVSSGATGPVDPAGGAP